MKIGWTLLALSFCAAAVYQFSGLDFTPLEQDTIHTEVFDLHHLYLLTTIIGSLLTTWAILSASRRARREDKSTLVGVLSGLVGVCGVAIIALWGIELASIAVNPGD